MKILWILKLKTTYFKCKYTNLIHILVQGSSSIYGAYSLGGSHGSSQWYCSSMCEDRLCPQIQSTVPQEPVQQLNIRDASRKIHHVKLFIVLYQILWWSLLVYQLHFCYLRIFFLLPAWFTEDICIIGMVIASFITQII